MRLAFLLAAAVGLAWFCLARRRFDFLTVAFLSACVYFLPGFFGYANLPLALGPAGRSTLLPETYGVMILVLGALTGAAWLFDLLDREDPLPWRLRDAGRAADVATLLGLAGCLVTVWTAGPELFSPRKADVIATLGRGFVLWEVGASLGAVLAVLQRRPLLAAIDAALIGFTVFVGFRAPAAMTLIALFTLYLAGKGPERFALRRWRIALAGVAAAGFLFAYKFLYIAVKAGRWDLVTSRLGDWEFYGTVISRSEPFTTQVILNEVLRAGFRTGPEHLAGAFYQFMAFSPELGAEIVSFNDLFQPRLFPLESAGMASNVWAEMWSAGGWPALILFVALFVSVVWLASLALRLRGPVLRGTFALLASYWVFYIHRNDILFQLALQKRVALVAAICVGLSMLLGFAARRAVAPPRETDAGGGGLEAREGLQRG